MAKNRYLIVIPPHKEPYIKSFNNPEKVHSVIVSKTEGAQLKKTASDLLEREVILFSADGKKKKTLPVNNAATDMMPIGDKEKIHGHAIISGVPGDEYCGFTLEDAERMLKEISNIRIGV